MRRRAFLGGVGGAVAGATVGVLVKHTRESEGSLFRTAFDAERGRGKLMLMANVGAAEERAAFEAAETEILKGYDQELALRLLLVHIQVIWDNDIARSLTGDVPKMASDWIGVTDGDVPRLGEQMPLDRTRYQQDLALFLPRVVPLEVPWLEKRAALAWRDNPELVRRIRRAIQDRSLTTKLAREAPAVVALEAMRPTTDYNTKGRLMRILVPLELPKQRFEQTYECGLAAIIMTPLGARFAAAFTKGLRSDGKRGPKKT